MVRRKEIIKWKKRCPIEFFKNDLLSKKSITLEKINELERMVEEEMQAAISFASMGSLEPVENLGKHLYENDL